MSWKSWASSIICCSMRCSAAWRSCTALRTARAWPWRPLCIMACWKTWPPPPTDASSTASRTSYSGACGRTMRYCRAIWSCVFLRNADSTCWYCWMACLRRRSTRPTWPELRACWASRCDLTVRTRSVRLRYMLIVSDESESIWRLVDVPLLSASLSDRSCSIWSCRRLPSMRSMPWSMLRHSSRMALGLPEPKEPAFWVRDDISTLPAVVSRQPRLPPLNLEFLVSPEHSQP